MITLTTDFGTRDPYVAEMKAVALRINPAAAFVDISHHIAPQNVLEGAFVLGSAYRFFPQDTIHVAVVDPGVGTSRRAILLTSPDGRFLAPDNGILTYAIRESAEYQTTVSGKGFGEPADVSIPEGYAAYELSNESLRLSPLSDTFPRQGCLCARGGASVLGHTAGGGWRAVGVPGLPVHSSSGGAR